MSSFHDPYFLTSDRTEKASVPFCFSYPSQNKKESETEMAMNIPYPMPLRIKAGFQKDPKNRLP